MNLHSYHEQGGEYSHVLKNLQELLTYRGLVSHLEDSY